MTDDQFKRLVDNQVRISKQLSAVLNVLDTLQSDVSTSLNNQQIMERYFNELQKDIKQIKLKVNS